MKRATKEITMIGFTVSLKKDDVHYSSMMSPFFQAFCRYFKKEFGDHFEGAYHDCQTKIFRVWNKYGQDLSFKLAKTIGVPLKDAENYPHIANKDIKWMFQETLKNPAGIKLYFVNAMEPIDFIKELGL